MEEIWQNIKDFDNYQVSNFGNIRSLNYNKTGKIKLFTPKDNGTGYLHVHFRKDNKWVNKYVHRIVAETFIGEIPKGYTVDHIDTNRSNNNVSNLKICSQKENSNNPLSSIHRKTVHRNNEGRPIINEITGEKFNSIIEAAEYYKCTSSAIWNILNHKNRKSKDGYTFKYL